jgi:hypothetical protein
MLLENGGQPGLPPPPRGAALRGDGDVLAKIPEVLTETTACPAAAVPGAQAACVKEAECWAGLLDLMGDVTAKRIACEESHVWETFAIAPLPSDSLTYDSRALKKHPTVKKCAPRRSCSHPDMETLAPSRPPSGKVRSYRPQRSSLGAV